MGYLYIFSLEEGACGSVYKTAGCYPQYHSLQVLSQEVSQKYELGCVHYQWHEINNGSRKSMYALAWYLGLIAQVKSNAKQLDKAQRSTIYCDASANNSKYNSKPYYCTLILYILPYHMQMSPLSCFCEKTCECYQFNIQVSTPECLGSANLFSATSGKLCSEKTQCATLVGTALRE